MRVRVWPHLLAQQPNGLPHHVRQLLVPQPPLRATVFPKRNAGTLLQPPPPKPLEPPQRVTLLLPRAPHAPVPKILKNPLPQPRPPPWLVLSPELPKLVPPLQPLEPPQPFKRRRRPLPRNEPPFQQVQQFVVRNKQVVYLRPRPKQKSVGNHVVKPYLRHPLRRRTARTRFRMYPNQPFKKKRLPFTRLIRTLPLLRTRNLQQQLPPLRQNHPHVVQPPQRRGLQKGYVYPNHLVREPPQVFP